MLAIYSSPEWLTSIVGPLLWLMPVVLVSALVLAAGSVFWESVLKLGTVAEAATVALMTVGLIGFVASEDTYRDDGTSRWDAYNSHGPVLLAVFFAAFSVTFLVSAWRLRRRDLAVAGFLVASLASVLTFAAVLANALN